MDALQRTFATLRPGSGFESARFRAEGRVLPSGYAKVGSEGERLVDDMDSGEHGEVEEEEGVVRRGASMNDREGRSALEVQHERDEFKMPVRPGEGWVAL